MPMPRRRSDPRELASVLDRLERLRAGSVPPTTPAPLGPIGTTASPWLPNVGASASARPAGVAAKPARAAAKPASLAAKVIQAWRAHAFDPGRRGLAV
ncbi:MAG: hypothetical protein ACRDV3_13295, partial [Acidothermaceae bacterium]